jgi:ferrous iron transport protein A
LKTKYLSKLKKGQTGTIEAFPDGDRAKLRLSEMGLRVGMQIKIVQIIPLKGPVVIQTGQTQIAIGHGMASRMKISLQKN